MKVSHVKSQFSLEKEPKNIPDSWYFLHINKMLSVRVGFSVKLNQGEEDLAISSPKAIFYGNSTPGS